MYAFIDAHRDADGVEPICRVLEIAPSAYYVYRQRQADATRPSARAQRDTALQVDIARIYRENHEVYGVRKVWRQLQRDGIAVARCTVERLMRAAGLQGVVRGHRVRTTRPDDTAAPSADLVQRQFSAAQPTHLWVADFTYVATWRGFVDVAFVIDVFSRRIVGWRAHTTMRTALVLDALEQALHDRELDGRLIVHTDRGSQYVAMWYTDRVLAVGAAQQPKRRLLTYRGVNALAESVIGLYKTEVIHRRGPWRGVEDVEYARLAWVAWFNPQRVLEPLGYLPPAEFEEHYLRAQATQSECLAVN